MSEQIKSPNRFVDMTEYHYEVPKSQDPNHIRFSKHLKTIQDKLPSWMRMKKDKRSTGALFLNVIGMELDDVEFIVDYAYKQSYIESVNLNQAYEAFKTVLPANLHSDYIYKVQGDIYDLEETNNMVDFLTGLPDDGLQYREVFYNNPYFIDWKSRVLYTRKTYNVSEEHEEGMVVLDVFKENGVHLETLKLPLRYHHVWNFLDEFGYLLDTPRLYREPNRQYKRRILDVFKHPANSGETGLRNGIARELSLVRYETWKDTGNPLYLKYPRVDPNTIEINGESVDSIYIRQTRRGRWAIEPMDNLGENAEVSYVTGVEMHELHNKENYAFQNELFTARGTATPKLEHYVQRITDQVPIFWGHFKWDEGFWDIANAEMSGYGYVPAYADASIDGWHKLNKHKGD